MTIAAEVTDPGQTIHETLLAHGVKNVYATTFNGPTITQYAYALEAGVKVAKVIAASKDIALALGLDDVRIVAPIPGTNFVGVEVPKAVRETVTYADFAIPWVDHGDDGHDERDLMALPIPVGVGIGGDAIWADLAKLPHLLVAGATGSGKSVALNSAITSLIDHRTPDEVRLWLIDPKRVELGIFERAPHVERLATDVEEAIEVLKSVVDIMDHRYELFEDIAVRNIGEYNDTDGIVGEDELPYHVVVVDELADLMMQAKAEVEPLIVRIAQLARAAGIHLVLATQRPTVNVVTGLIAANVVSRWVFAVRSSTDSKVALEEVGAQALYGQGDSLWYPAGAAKPVRVQGVFTDPATLAGILDAAEDQHPDVETTASPRAATEDDDFDLADVGVPAPLQALDEPYQVLHQPITAETIHAHTITFPEGETCPTGEHAVPTESVELEEGVEPKQVLDAIEGVDFEAQEALAKELRPIIDAMVDEKVAALEADEDRRKEKAYELVANRWDRRIQLYVFLPAGIAVLGRVFGAW